MEAEWGETNEEVLKWIKHGEIILENYRLLSCFIGSKIGKKFKYQNI